MSLPKLRETGLEVYSQFRIGSIGADGILKSQAKKERTDQAIKDNDLSQLFQEALKPWVPRTGLSSQAAVAKMGANAAKAFWAGDKCKEIYPAWALLSSLTPWTSTPHFTTSMYGAMGNRRDRTMEDRHFHVQEVEGILQGVYDGHGGAAVAQYVSDHFSTLFFTKLRESQGDIYQTLELCCYEIEEELKNDPKPFNCFTGSTAAISFIDTQLGVLYTATLADTETATYFYDTEETKIFPNSCVRNWSSYSDATRLAALYNDVDILKRYLGAKDPKGLRIPPGPLGTLNISRAFGDIAFLSKEKKPLVSCKPKITALPIPLHPTQPTVIMTACDGLWDFVTKQEAGAILQQAMKEGLDIAPALVHHAIDRKRSYDNVTVVATQISLPKQETLG